MKSIKHTIIPYDYPACYNEWRLQLEMNLDQLQGTDVAIRSICQQADYLIDQAREVLILNR